MLPVLQMNVEQDSTGKTEWCAAFNTEHGTLIGRAITPDGAVLDLAAQITSFRVRPKRAIPMIDISKWRETFERSINQPAMSADILGIKQPDNWDYARWREAVNAASKPENPSVGRIVWYIPTKGEFENVKGGVMAAMITRVRDHNVVDIQVFMVDQPGTRYVSQVEYGGALHSGTWVWPIKQN